MSSGNGLLPHDQLMAWSGNTNYLIKLWTRFFNHDAIYDIFPEAEIAITFELMTSGPYLNIKMLSYQYRNSHLKDKMVSWPS